MTRNMRKLTVLMLATFLATTPALAEDSVSDSPSSINDERLHDDPRNGEEMKKRMEERFMKGDTDKDGFLSKEEMQAEQEKRFDEVFSDSDKDSDGRLSRDEMREGHKAMREKFKQRMEGRREKMGDRRGGGEGEEGRSGEGGREKFRERMEERRGGRGGD